MKKLICLMSLMLVAGLALALPVETTVKPQDYDVGIVENAAIVDMGGVVFNVNYEYEIVDWQAPVVLEGMSEMAAQVVDAIVMPTMEGEISVTLVSFIWPNSVMSESYYWHDTLRNCDKNMFSPGDYNYSFTPALTVT